MRGWYARRGVSWAPLLACLGLASVGAAAGHRWPDALVILLPAALAGCAAAAGFVFDEAAVAVVAVTPRGSSWRRGTRLAVAAVPLLWWLAVVGTLPRAAQPDRTAWSIVGLACVCLAAGGAALASRRGVPTPGTVVAPVVAGLVLTPLVIGPVAGWQPVLPQGAFSAGLTTAWVLGAALAGGVTAWAVRPGLR